MTTLRETTLSRWLHFDLRDLLFIGLMVIPGLALLATAGDITTYFRYRVLDGQFLYVASKFIGLYAFLMLWLQVMYGLLGEGGRRRLNIPSELRLHRHLAYAVLTLFTLHIALFVTGVSIRNGHFAYKLLLPHIEPYYQSMVSLGLLGAVLLFATVVFAWWRDRVPGLWKWGHRLSLPAFFAIYFHSFLIGSETRVGLMEYLYYGMLVSVVAALGLRLFQGLSGRNA